jgi:acetyl-CoA acetyltransferase
MLETDENLAKKYEISWDNADEFAARTQQRAQAG